MCVKVGDEMVNWCGEILVPSSGDISPADFSHCQFCHFRIITQPPTKKRPVKLTNQAGDSFEMSTWYFIRHSSYPTMGYIIFGFGVTSNISYLSHSPCSSITVAAS